MVGLCRRAMNALFMDFVKDPKRWVERSLQALSAVRHVSLERLQKGTALLEGSSNVSKRSVIL